MNLNFYDFIYLNSEMMTFFIINILLIVYMIERLYFKNELDKKYLWLLSFLFMFILWLLIKNLIDNETINSIYFFNNYFVYNDFIVFIKIIMIISLLFYFIYFYNFNNLIKLPFFEYIILVLIAFFGLLIIVSSNNLFVIFLFLELVNLCIYCLIALNKYSNKGIECSYKYFIQSAFSTIIGFFAISLLYMSNGTLFINELGLLITYNNINILSSLGILLLMLSIFFKLGMFPLHSWLPDVYQGSYLVTALFIATIPKLAYISFLFKLFYEFYFLIDSFSLLIAFITIIYGSIISLYQVNLRRLIGYGSMVHIGFIIYSLSIYNIDGVASSFFYLLFYITLIFFLFTFILLLHEKNINKSLFLIENISQLGLILNKNKILAILLSFILLSLAGLPFFVGFISKWYVFLVLISKHKFIELFILLIVSIISSAYYIRLIRFLFFTEVKNSKVNIYFNIKYSDSLFIFLIFLFILNIFIILFHSYIYLFIVKKIIFVYF